MRRALFIFVVLVSVPRAAWPQGNPLGPAFRVNTYTTGNQYAENVASDASGNFVVVWGSNLQDGSGRGVFGQRYSASGGLLGPEFPVNTYTTGDQSRPSVAADTVGNFVVVWQSYGQDGSNSGVVTPLWTTRASAVGAPTRALNTSRACALSNRKRSVRPRNTRSSPR